MKAHTFRFSCFDAIMSSAKSGTPLSRPPSILRNSLQPIHPHLESLKMKTRSATAREVPTQVQASIPPTDVGMLTKLPEEIRNMIYELVLTQPEELELQCYQPHCDELEFVIDGQSSTRVIGQEVAPVKHKRVPQRRGQRWTSKGWVEVPSKSALLQVNKQLNEEATSILYGTNSFSFTTSRALERFLKQIGDNKWYLRTVSLSYPRNINDVNQAVQGLMAARRLRKIRLIDVPVTRETSIITPQNPSFGLSMNFASMCLPILRSLEAMAKSDNVRMDILNVLEIHHWGCKVVGIHSRKSDCPKGHRHTCLGRPNAANCGGINKDLCVKYRETHELSNTILKETVSMLTNPSAFGALMEGTEDESEDQPEGGS